MTQEEKELLLKDLSTRLPYGVVIKITSDGGMVEASYDMRLDAGVFADLLNSEDDFIPYLRPMSSMTEEERELYKSFAVAFGDSRDIMLPNYAAMDWLNAHNFDYRGLIEKGLALEAPEGMYNKEDK